VLGRADELNAHLGVDADFRPARRAHPALIVAGLAKLIERLRWSGVTVRDDEPLAGDTRVYFDDPFDNRLEPMELRHRRGPHG
jgi:catechol 2,3-dioxygenase-like lactoylglutathione lyase family enzyme